MTKRTSKAFTNALGHDEAFLVCGDRVYVAGFGFDHHCGDRHMVSGAPVQCWQCLSENAKLLANH